jgi:hypothetical protein
MVRTLVVALVAAAPVAGFAQSDEPGAPKSSDDAPKSAEAETPKADDEPAPGEAKGVVAGESAGDVGLDTPDVDPGEARGVDSDDAGRPDFWSEDFDKMDHVVVLESLNLRADDIQRKIADLKSRVDLLRESANYESITPSKALVVHNNRLGESFALEKVEYFMDGKSVMRKESKDGALDEQTEFEVLNGGIDDGVRAIEVSMVVRGNGRGVYTELKGYRFKIGSRYLLQVAEGRLSRLDVIVEPRKALGLAPKDRIGIRYEMDVKLITGSSQR